MIVQLFELTPDMDLTGRGQLFEKFAEWYLTEQDRIRKTLPPFPYFFPVAQKKDLLRALGDRLVGIGKESLSREEIKAL